MSLTISVFRSLKSQDDIAPDRPSGRSCCTFFCSKVALCILQLPASSAHSALEFSQLKGKLLQAVSDWDNTGLVDGAAAHTVLASCCKEQGGVELDVLVEGQFVARADLQQMLSEYENRVVLVTAIPISAEGEAQQRTGKTFLIASLRNAIYLLDSHTHHPFDPLAKPGMLRACVASTCASKRAQVLCDWIWDDRGFLMELQCDRHLVDITVLRKAVCPSVSSQRAQQGMAVAVACQGASAVLGISSDAL